MSDFRVLHPLKDPSFYAALFASAALACGDYHSAGALAAAAAPLVAWLAGHGYIRGKALDAAALIESINTQAAVVGK